MKKYPAIGSKKPAKNLGGLPCIICGAPTTGKVEIEVSYFRGDDEVVRVCDVHQKQHDKEILEALTWCGKLSDGRPCRLPKGSSCPDCGRGVHDFNDNA